MNREQAINYLISSGFTHEQVGEVVRALTYEPTTKNNLEHHKQNIKAYAHDFGVSEEQAEKELRVTTKNDSSELEKNSKKLEKDFGELDCISRADAIQAMQDKAKKLKNEDTINGLCGAVAILYEMSSVTPQEPIDKKFTKADIDAIVKAINEGWELRVNEILGKIRAEIIELRSRQNVGVLECLDIIDKYRAEAEEDEEHPINENIAKGFEEFTKMMFRQGQAEREEKE